MLPQFGFKEIPIFYEFDMKLTTVILTVVHMKNPSQLVVNCGTI